MPRIIQITIPQEETDQLLEEIKQLPELISIRVQRGISLHPPGDVISLESSNRSLPGIMTLLDHHQVFEREEISISTSEPLSIIAPPQAALLVNDVSDSTWEEMEFLIGKGSNMTVNGILIMAISGILATIGIATNALHVVIGAMVIAPGFEPISRIALGVIAKSRAIRTGLYHTAVGYAAMVTGAIATTLLLQSLGKNPMGGEASYLPEGVLISYWTSITLPSLIVSAVSAITGAILIATNKSVLTAGVMIALALVPAATIIGIALISGEMDIALKSAVRWLIEAGFVVFFSALVFLWKRRNLHQRSMFF